MTKLSYYGYTNRGGRPENEDGFALQQTGPERIYAAVADGLGGHGGGRAASGIALKSVSQCGQCKALPTQENIAQWLEQANDEILRTRSDPSQMKTTVTFLCINENKAIWAHIGDTRIYHFYNEQPVEVTEDHSMTQIAVSQGEITREQMPFHPDRSRLLRVLGAEDMKPDIHAPVILTPGRHAFLLCTDGFWEWVRETEILMDLHKAASAQQWIEGLRHRGEKRRISVGTPDNHTAVAVFTEVGV